RVAHDDRVSIRAYRNRVAEEQVVALIACPKCRLFAPARTVEGEHMDKTADFGPVVFLDTPVGGPKLADAPGAPVSAHRHGKAVADSTGEFGLGRFWGFCRFSSPRGGAQTTTSPADQRPPRQP